MPTQRNKILWGAGIGLAVTAPLTAVMYLALQLFGLPFVASDLFESITRIPALGPLVTVGIDTMVKFLNSVPGIQTDTAAKSAEQLSAVLLFLVLGAVAGVLYALLRDRIGSNDTTTVGIAAWMLVLVLEVTTRSGDVIQMLLVVAWLGVIFLLWGYVLSKTIQRILGPSPSSVSALAGSPAPAAALSGLDRRTFLTRFVGGAAAITIAGWGAAQLFGHRGNNSAGQAIADVPPATQEAAATEAASVNTGPFTVVPGTRAEVTANDQFYRVDVNVVNVPYIDDKTYKLTVGGSVDKQLALSYKDITGMTPTVQDATLECISNPVGGDLISSTRWTGIKLKDVLTQAGLKSTVTDIQFTCADGYMETLPLQSAMDERTILAYGMNGAALADIHGFPLRLYTPNRYGMKNPKWITGISALDTPSAGYWEVRGWDKEAIVKTTSVIDIVATDKAQNGIVPVGGIAFAGARGISKVELSIDGGSWQEAQLKDPVSGLTWRLWRYDWKAAKGHHELRVRATDGQGQLQTDVVADLQPNGASGYVSVSVDV